MGRGRVQGVVWAAGLAQAQAPWLDGWTGLGLLRSSDRKPTWLAGPGREGMVAHLGLDGARAQPSGGAASVSLMWRAGRGA